MFYSVSHSFLIFLIKSKTATPPDWNSFINSFSAKSPSGIGPSLSKPFNSILSHTRNLVPSCSNITNSFLEWHLNYKNAPYYILYNWIILFEPWTHKYKTVFSGYEENVSQKLLISIFFQSFLWNHMEHISCGTTWIFFSWFFCLLSYVFLYCIFCNITNCWNVISSGPECFIPFAL